jgi:tetratricopeptide (TPR) repeat protein
MLAVSLLNSDPYDRDVLEEAIAATREGMRLDPRFMHDRAFLGTCLFRAGRAEEAIPWFREAIRSGSRHANIVSGCIDLGDALQAVDRYEEAIEAYEAGLELAPETGAVVDTLRARIAQCSTLVSKLPRARRMIAGVEEPYDDDGRVLGGLAQVTLGLGRGDIAARLYSLAFVREPQLPSDEPWASHRFKAACAAAQASRATETRPALTPATTSREWRQRALEWLRTEIDRMEREAEDGVDQWINVDFVVRHWQHDSRLAPVRDPSSLAGLQADERAAWEDLWSRVASVRSKSKSE